MNEEATISPIDAIAAMQVLMDELTKRIKHGDGDIDGLSRVIDALASADRIVIHE